MKEYQVKIQWNGNIGAGTSSYRGYERSHSIQVQGKPDIPGSSDPAFRGDITRYNPEELLVASLSSCHMLWYLHLCADAGVCVVAYADAALGSMKENADGSGAFVEVMLNPVVTVTEESMTIAALQLHEVAHERCFIANSVNFLVHHQPVIKVVESTDP